MAKVIKNAPATSPKKKTDEKPIEFAFGKENYILLLAGIVLIILGFILMVGGGSKDPKVFNEAIYSFQRLTLAPILILSGFVVEILAIIKKPKD
jgi:membrane-bound ClpP family serine protease